MIRTLFAALLLLGLALRALAADPILLDMVHNNPGEQPFQTHYNDPAYLKSLGYTGKVFFLFESAQLAVNWDSVDPAILPAGSDARKWVDAKAAELDKKYSEAKATGLDVYCESDLILFPRALVEKEHLEKTMSDPNDPGTQKYLGLLLEQMFKRFPQLDGIVVRIGETYLQDAPYHIGAISDKSDARKTIIPLVRFLRENVCVKLHKKVIFRTWLSFDADLQKYLAVSDAVEPHENLLFSIKHCEGDFHRGNPFSRILGAGRHRFIVEVECQREYEGKGAYPNYITAGVIDGFEEHAAMTAPHSLREIAKSPLYAGVWTWSRGGGWGGPYISNELWCDLNAQVLAAWVRYPERTEEALFTDFCREKLRLDDAGAAKFRKLALLSADAVLRGKRSTQLAKEKTIGPWWTRDDFIAAPPLPSDPAARPQFLAEKEDAVEKWNEIVKLGDQIHFSDPATAEYVAVSTRYGLDLYRIYRAGFQLAALGHAAPREKLDPMIAEYDRAWADFRQLQQEHPSCATLYKDVAFRGEPGIGAFVDSLRLQPAPATTAP